MAFDNWKDKHIVADLGYETECWVWTGCVTAKGYGGSTPYQAHKNYYTHYVGPVPEGMEVDHLCSARICVNPAHLEVVTPYENKQRRRKLSIPRRDELYARVLASLNGNGHLEYGLGPKLAQEFGISHNYLYALIQEAKAGKPRYAPKATA